MSATRHCEECRAVLDPTKVLRCIKCKVCFYCSRECQTRNWRLHKRVCTTEPLFRRFMPVEMAVERSLAKQPSMEQAPKEAFCYICLEGEDGGKSSKLRRGCACRGDTAGFVHLECLTKLAKSKEASEDLDAACYSWLRCGNCKQDFTGALELDIKRRFWRRHRSSQDVGFGYDSMRHLAICLGLYGEVDSANQLLDAASNCVSNGQQLLDLKLLRVAMLKKNGQKLEALGILQAMLPEARAYTAAPYLFGGTLYEIVEVFLDLDRNQEAHEAAAELVAFNKEHFSMESTQTLNTLQTYAVACAKIGRLEEAKVHFEDVLTTQTRVMGREHPHTQNTWQAMLFYGFAVPSG